MFIDIWKSCGGRWADRVLPKGKPKGTVRLREKPKIDGMQTSHSFRAQSNIKMAGHGIGYPE